MGRRRSCEGCSVHCDGSFVGEGIGGDGAGVRAGEVGRKAIGKLSS